MKKRQVVTCRFFWRRERDSGKRRSRAVNEVNHSFELSLFSNKKNKHEQGVSQCRAFFWRRERDSNPRNGLTFTRFPIVRLRPAQPSLHKPYDYTIKFSKRQLFCSSSRKNLSFYAFSFFDFRHFVWFIKAHCPPYTYFCW